MAISIIPRLRDYLEKMDSAENPELFHILVESLSELRAWRREIHREHYEYDTEKEKEYFGNDY
jgi:hypothetical protein